MAPTSLWGWFPHYLRCGSHITSPVLLFSFAVLFPFLCPPPRPAVTRLCTALSIPRGGSAVSAPCTPQPQPGHRHGESLTLAELHRHKRHQQTPLSYKLSNSTRLALTLPRVCFFTQQTLQEGAFCLSAPLSAFFSLSRRCRFTFPTCRGLAGRGQSPHGGVKAVSCLPRNEDPLPDSPSSTNGT